jgi:NTE family protein
LWLKGDFARGLFNQMSANLAMFAGAAGFFALRNPPAWLHPDGALEATSFYDTKLLKSTLERFVDFERINSGETRLSVGAVNVRSGNFVYFDTLTHAIGPEHVMASGSLPPGFPSAEIEGEFYWDGGLISNTPLQWVAEHGLGQDTLAFQVDLWSARGDLPRNLLEVATRQKEIQYSSRKRITSSLGCPWRTIGELGIRTRCGPCDIPKCWSGREAVTGFSSSISTGMVGNDHKEASARS